MHLKKKYWIVYATALRWYTSRFIIKCIVSMTVATKYLRHMFEEAYAVVQNIFVIKKKKLCKFKVSSDELIFKLTIEDFHHRNYCNYLVVWRRKFKERFSNAKITLNLLSKIYKAKRIKVAANPTKFTDDIKKISFVRWLKNL